MKIINSLRFFLITTISAVILSSCNEDEKPIEPILEENLPNVTNPFPFYKLIAIKEGFSFEVLSWGKGVDSLGGYLLLMSDSVKNNYKSIAIDRKGIIKDAWNMDLDNDGNPELYIQFVVRKVVNDLNVYEFTNNSFNKISFPGLNNEKGYEGNDEFFVKSGELFRKVPIMKIENGKTTSVVKTLRYNLSGNNFSTSEIKPDK